MYSIQEAVSDGTLVLLLVTIKYLDKDHITVTINAVPPDQLGYSFVWDGDAIRFNVPLPQGAVVRCIRNTPRDGLVHVFQGGVDFTDKTVDESLLQQLYLNQENLEQNIGGVIVPQYGTQPYRVEELAVAVGQTSFTLTTFTFVPSAHALEVYLNGVLLHPSTYTEDADGKTITLLHAPASTGKLLVRGAILDSAPSDVIHTFANYAAITAYTGAVVAGYVNGREHIFDGAGGNIYCDLTDTTSLGNDGTIWVDALGRRWKRQINDGRINVLWFGAKGNGDADDYIAIQKAADTLKNAFGGDYYNASRTNNVSAILYFPRGFFLISDEIQIPRGIKVIGENARNHGGSRIKQTTSGKACFNCYTLYVHAGQNQYIADQQISNLFFSAVNGSAIKAVKPAGTTDFYSMGSFTVEDCFFLDITSPTGSSNACIDVDYAERIAFCTFDAVEAIGVRAGAISSHVGNAHFNNGRGGVIIDLARKPANVATSIDSSNQFINCGSGVESAVYKAAIGVIGSGDCDLLFIDAIIAGNGSSGVLGFVAPDARIINSELKLNGVNLRGDLASIHSSKNTKYTINAVNCGNSIGAYTFHILNKADNCTFTDMMFRDNGGSFDFYLGDTSVNNYINGMSVAPNRVRLPATFGRMINSGTSTPNSGGSLATNWSLLPLGAGWTGAAPIGGLRYRIDELGYVRVQGTLSNGSLSALIGNMPVGFRPLVDVSASVTTSTGTLNFVINTIGDVYLFQLNGGSNVNVAINACYSIV